MTRAAFPTPYAGTYYPIYNSGVNQYIVPLPTMPFRDVSAIFVAFAHAYPIDPTDLSQGATLALEQGQPEEPERLLLLTSVARAVNHGIKILISLGWGHNDWTYIGADYRSGKNEFAPSVVAFIRKYKLDGFDIDDESVSGISQPEFDGVIQNLRNALDAASAADGKPYFLTITPAFGTAQVTPGNMNNFDLINAQCYAGSFPQDFINLGYPKGQIAWGIDTEGCTPDYPTPAQYQGLAGIFNWTMSADSVCSNFEYTRKIAADVGYNGKSQDVTQGGLSAHAQ